MNNVSYLNINRNKYSTVSNLEYIYNKYGNIIKYDISENSYTNIIFDPYDNINNMIDSFDTTYSYIYNEQNIIFEKSKFNSSYITAYINDYINDKSDSVTVIFPKNQIGKYENEYAKESYEIMSYMFDDKK